ncbi:MAG: hypothetical protein ABIJ56_19155, partial [Pseudomonadota bacterium]
KPDEGKVLVNGSRIRGLTPITQKDTIGMGKAKLCIAIQGDPKKKLVGTYFAQIQILTKCPECGHPVPVNGLLNKIHCNTCQSDFTWSGNGWKMFLEDIQSSVMTSGGMSTNYLSHGTTVEATAATPVCPSCKKSIPGEALEGCEGGSVSCPGCGHAMGCCPAPQWLAEAFPNLKAVYGGEAEPGGGEAVELSGQAGKPVLFKCPGCNATLKITAGSERVTTCEFCKSDVYLPDDLWLRLHPAKKMEPWYVRFEGKTSDILEYEKESRKFIGMQQVVEQGAASMGFFEDDGKPPAESAAAARSRSGLIAFIVIGLLVVAALALFLLL